MLYRKLLMKLLKIMENWILCEIVQWLAILKIPNKYLNSCNGTTFVACRMTVLFLFYIRCISGFLYQFSCKLLFNSYWYILHIVLCAHSNFSYDSRWHLVFLPHWGGGTSNSVGNVIVFSWIDFSFQWYKCK